MLLEKTSPNPKHSIIAGAALRLPLTDATFVRNILSTISCGKNLQPQEIALNIQQRMAVSA